MSKVGSMRHMIDLVAKTQVPDADANAGGTETFTTITSDEGLMASLRTVKPVNKDGQLNREDGVTHIFRSRYVAAYGTVKVDAALWVDFDGRKFKVEAVDNVDERSRFMDLFTREVGVAPTGLL